MGFSLQILRKIKRTMTGALQHKKPYNPLALRHAQA
jgi:hypothetical protein